MIRNNRNILAKQRLGNLKVFFSTISQENVATKTERDALAQTRIFEVTNVLKSTHKWNKKVKEYIKIYNNPVMSIFEDLLVVLPGSISDQLHPSIVAKPFQQILFNDLINLLNTEKYSVLEQSIMSLSRWHVLPKVFLNDEVFKQITAEPVLLRNNLIALTLYSGHNLLGTSLILGTMSTTKIPSKYIKLALLNLCVYTKNESVTIQSIYCIMRVLNRFTRLDLSTTEKESIVRFLLSVENDYPSFSNMIFDKFSSQSNTNIGLPLIFQLVHKNLEFGNLPRAFSIWKSYIQPRIDVDTVNVETTLYLIDELSLYLNTEAQFDELLKGVPEEVLHLPSIEGSLIRALGRTKTTEAKFNDFVRTVNPPISRDTLALLLEMFILKDDFVNTRKILKFINNDAEIEDGGLLGDHEGLTETEFTAISLKLIKTNRYKAAFEITQSRDIEMTKYSIINLIEFSLLKKFESYQSPKLESGFGIQQDDLEKIESYGLSQFDRLDPVHDIKVFEAFSKKIFRLVLRFYGLYSAKAFFKLFSSKNNGDEYPFSMRMQASQLSTRRNSGSINNPTNHYAREALPTEELFKLKPYLLMTERQRIPMLMSILGCSLNDVSLSTWCIKEIVKTGMPLTEVMGYLKYKYPHVYFNLFKDPQSTN